MKTYILKSLILGIILIFSGTSKAEVNLNLNFGLPAWGPAGYEHERYYYLPDVEAYYDTRWGMFVYYNDGVWLHRSQLPAIYVNYNLFNGYKVVMNGHRGYIPYMNFKSYKVKYAKGYNPGRQKAIGNNRGKGNSNNKPNSSFKNHKGNGNSNEPNFKNNKQGHSNGNSNRKNNGGNSGGDSHQDKQKNVKGSSQGHSKSGGGNNNGGKKGKK